MEFSTPAVGLIYFLKCILHFGGVFLNIKLIFCFVRYHLGSLAFGSLILALVHMVRVILEYIEEKLKGAENAAAKCIVK